MLAFYDFNIEITCRAASGTDFTATRHLNAIACLNACWNLDIDCLLGADTSIPSTFATRICDDRSISRATATWT